MRNNVGRNKGSVYRLRRGSGHVDGHRIGQWRRHVWELLELTSDGESGGFHWDWVDISLATLICLNVLAVILQSVRSLDAAYHTLFAGFEVFSVAVFTVEYLARLWACTADPRYASPVRGRLTYLRSFFALVDLMAVAPFYLMLALPMGVLDLRFVRVIRLLRLLRILKLGRYSEAAHSLGNVFRAKRHDLMVALSAVGIALIFASSLMYNAENAAQPDKFSSIPASMWWGISTLTTVGYGDLAPVTTLGKILAGLIQILGVALFGLPMGILAAGYQDEARRRRQSPHVCPMCGQPVAVEVDEDEG
jgi:voltage-gated potassium channel